MGVKVVEAGTLVAVSNAGRRLAQFPPTVVDKELVRRDQISIRVCRTGKHAFTCVANAINNFW